ncbi:GlyGly-CTERM sorting domain-containing protein [Shewanella hanedai]|uniref:Tandem-95 repeat protein n=1 Tax=Shewanella hanedai TaxID=25 RepID=A0A553JPT5_SHEHA|nr:tandem-95 repeat protein [Shewanella hanedai]TRY14479.1 tandem-95 repeat protein [Shewanella hanedai]GGI78663.1 GlyGly-CTERM sorting domain-containing protein [Shewanella hanedai]
MKFGIFLFIIGTLAMPLSASTLNFESGVSGNGTQTITAIVDGITFTAVSNDDTWLIADNSGNAGTTANVAAVNYSTGASLITLSFSSPVNLTSIHTSDISLTINSLTFTPTDGSGNSAFTDNNSSTPWGGNSTGNTVSFSSWSNPTSSFTISGSTSAGNLMALIMDNIIFTVAPTNNAPTTASFNGDSFTYTEGDGGQILDQGTQTTVSDADGGDFDAGNLTLTITSGEDAAEDILSIDTSGAISLAGTTASSNVSITGPGVIGTLGNNIAAGNNFVINLNASATPAHVQTLVRALTYENSDTDNPTTGARNVRLTINDGDGGTSSNADITVTVAATNDNPNLTNLASDNLNYSEGAGQQNIDIGANATVTDVDSINFDTGNLTVTIPTNKDASEDILGFDNTVTTTGLASASITISATNIGTLTNAISEANDLIITFNANATPSLAQALIRAITYQNSDNVAPTESTRTVRFALTDGDGGSSGNIDTTVVVSAVNDLPVGSNNTLTPNEGGVLTITTSDFGYSDVEGNALSYITITAAPVNGSLWIDVDSSGTINNAESALTSNDTVTKANLDANVLKYSPSGSTSASFTFTVNDGVADSASNYTITLTVNAQPTVTINQASGQSDPTNNATVVFDVLFNESITGFDVSDISLTGDVTASVTSVSASSGTSFTVSTNISANEGDIIAQVLAGGVTDASSATNQASTSTDNTIKYDISAPTSPSSLDLIIGSDSGSSDSDNLTSDATPEISGSGETGATITLFSDADNSGTLNGSETSVTTSVSTGTWSVSMPMIASTSHGLKAFQTDPAGNASPVSTTLTIEIDTNAPSGHSVVIDQDPVNSSNQDSVSFTFTGGEISSNFSYTLSSSGGGTPLIGTGTLSTATDTINNIDVSSLTDGTLTFSTILTDTAGNSATAVNDTSVKDSTAPNGHSVSIDQALILASNDDALSFTFSSAETGASFAYTVSSSGGGTINGTGTLSSVNDTVSNVDVTSLGDGTLTLSVIVTDINSNPATAVVDTVSKDALGPVVQSVTLNTGNVKAGDIITVTVQFDDTLVLSGSNSTATLTIGGTTRTAVYTSGHNASSLVFSYTVVNGDNDSDGVTVTSAQGNSDTAKDANGNDADFSFTAFTEASLLVDTQAPVSATPLQTSQAVNADTLTLSQADYPEDAITVTALSDADGNGIADSNTPLTSSTSSSGSWSLSVNLSQDSDNYFILRTSDLAGNTTDTAIGNYLEDSISPDNVIIQTPITHVYQSTNAITIQGSQSENGISVGIYEDIDNNGVADNNTAISSTTVAANSWSISLTLADNTNTNYVVIAKDDAGNSAQAVDLVTLTHDNINPVADITKITSVDTTPTLNGTISDTGGLASLSFTLEDSNNTIFGPFDADSFSDINSGNWLDNELASTLTDGSYDAHLTPIDLAGNTQSITISDAVTIDTLAPTGYNVEIEQNRIDAGNESALSFIITGGNNGESFTYQISDGSNSVTGSGSISSDPQTVSGVNVSSLNEGTLTLTLSLTDVAGNQGADATDSLSKTYNLAPVISQGSLITITMSEDANPTPFSLNLSASDPDADSLNWQISSTTSQGVASILETGNNASVSYVPTADFNGNDNLTVQVSDGILTSSITVNIIITAINDTPNISGSPSNTIEEDTQFNFTPAASDIDSTLLTFNISGRPSWASFNPSTGTLSGTPTNEDVGNFDGIIISVRDDLGATSNLPTFSITVTNVNDAPVISGTPASSVDEDSLYSFTPTLLDADSNDTHSFSVSNKPNWASFNGSNGTLSGTPANEDVGISSNIVISVTDSAIASASLPAFSIEVSNINDIPTLNSTQLEALEDTELLFNLDANDDDGDALTISLINQPQQGTLDTSGSQWVYKANENFHGDDNFTVTINDEQTSSDPIEVNIKILPVNDAPNAQNDTFELDYTPSGEYRLSVLANDQDVDEDTLSLVSAESSLGTVEIDNEALLLTLSSGVTGDIHLSYFIVDPDGENSQAEVNLQITPNDEALPTLTVPEAVSVQAEGLFTRVDLGVAKAFDSKGEPLPVSLKYGQPLFQPGRHTVYWETTDSKGNTKVASQQVDVYPLVNFHKDQLVVEGTSASVTLSLNGDSPLYPVVIDFVLEGDAQADEDYRLVSQQAVITSGREITLEIEILEDGIDEPDEKLELVLDEAVNSGYKPSHLLHIVNRNIAPEISLEVTQSGEQSVMLSKDGGEISITAKYSDINQDDQLSISWAFNDIQIQDLDPSTDVIRFDPTEVELGSYQIKVEVSDGLLTTQIQGNLNLVSSLPTLDSSDSDGDMIPDNIEGFGDDDLDGVANFMDALPSCNVQPENENDQVQYLIEGEAGVCIKVGSIATGGEQNTLLLDKSDALPVDSEFRFTSGVFDFVASGLPVQGNQYRIVLPLTMSIPANAVYRKYSQAQGWYDFVEDDSNHIHSAIGESGYCPSPGESSWQTGLIEGAWCIQLTIVDGGSNDDDGEANFHITDPGGVAITNTSNRAPYAEDDSIELIESSLLLLDPTLNDSDPEGDDIQLQSVQGRLGTASINNEGQLQYQAATGYLGEDQVLYTITDGEGNSATATVHISVKANKAPVVQNDRASTNDRTAILVDVLSNDSDEQTLTLTYVNAEFGLASITSDNQVQYTPQLGYEGEDLVIYRIKDQLGSEVEGTLTVTVDAYQKIEVNNDSSGGSMGWISGALLLLLGIIRKKNSLVTLLTTSLLYCTTVHAQWSIDVQSGYSQTSSDIDISQLEDLGLQVSQFANDNSDRSWGLGIGYEVVPNWQINLGYQDLGNYGFSLDGMALNPTPSVELASTLGPRSASGIDLGLTYHWELSDSLGLKLGGGVWYWRSDFTSIINQVQVNRDENGGDWFSDLSLYWRISPQWQIDLGWQHFIIDKDDINNGFARINFMF